MIGWTIFTGICILMMVATLVAIARREYWEWRLEQEREEAAFWLRVAKEHSDNV